MMHINDIIEIPQSATSIHFWHLFLSAFPRATPAAMESKSRSAATPKAKHAPRAQMVDHTRGIHGNHELL